MVEQVEAPKEKITDGMEVVGKFASEYPTQETIEQFYNQFSGDGYDNWAKTVNFTEPKEFCKLIGPGLPANVEPNCEVLDVGSGTGIVGLYLKEKGFTNITGVDASESMLEKLKSLGAYKESRHMRLGEGVEKYPEDLKGKFDLVTASGVFLYGHIPYQGLDDVHASLKTNGYFVTGMRSTYWVKG